MVEQCAALHKLFPLVMQKESFLISACFRKEVGREEKAFSISFLKKGIHMGYNTEFKGQFQLD